MKLSLIGPGRVGGALLRLAARRGCAIDAIVTRHPERMRPLAEEVGAAWCGDDPARIGEDCDIVLVCVPDDAIVTTARALAAARGDWRGTTIAHSSGSATSAALAAVAACGAITGSLHPIQSFASGALPPAALDAIGCGIEGDARFHERIMPIVRLFGWRPLTIAPENKAIYHAACVFAGNFLTALAADAALLLEGATGTPDALPHLLPMMRHVLDELESVPPAAALTGPAARGDAATIARHVAAIERHRPELGTVYAELTRRILALSRLSEEEKHRILTLVDDRGGH